jgi:hypothetical protein
MIAEYPEFYCSAPPVKGAMNRKAIDRTARILEASFKDVADCYRGGEAFRCRFLVPSLPAGNPTPDELGMMAKPEWLNPDYGEGEDEGMLALTGEDQDTADVVLGDR